MTEFNKSACLELQRRIGMVVRISRNVRGMTLQQVAAAGGLRKGNLSKIENGSVNITIETLCRIAHALGTTPEDLFKAAK